MSEPTWFDDLSVQFDPVGSWLLVALVTILLVAVLLAFPPDRTRLSSGRRWMLMAVRVGAFLSLVACLLRPTLVSTRKSRQETAVLLLADASESMTVADGRNGRSRWEEMTTALEAARPAAEALLAGGDFTLASWTFDRELHPRDPADDPLALGSWEDSATADETALGAAVDEALRLNAGRRIGGVIVLSDGGQHAYPPRDLPPQTAARNVAAAGAPVWSVTFGQQRSGSQGRDAAAVNLAVAETVYLENRLEVAGRVRLDGLAGRPVTVLLQVEAQDGQLEEVARTTVQAVGESDEQPVRLEWTPREVGEKKLLLTVEPQEGEVVLTNNQLATFVNCIEGGLRVLFLEGALRVEQRFLRRVLSASPDIQVDFRWIDSSRRDDWPVDLARPLAEEYDVYLIGDLDSAALRTADLETILERVRQGAGIGLLGGFHAFEAGGWASSAVGPLMPFEADRLARQPFDEPVREGLHYRGPLLMRPDERFGGISILRLGSTAEETRAAWTNLPALTGANRLGRLLPVTKPLAGTPDGRPLLVAREYGAGRVLAFAADSTWRWVMQGAVAEHRRFWRQLVLWLARKDEADADSIWVRLAQRRISPGTPLEFDAGVTGPDGEARLDLPLEAEVVSPQGETRSIRVVRTGDTYAGTVSDAVEPGDWTLRVRTREPDGGEPRERAARFTIFRQDLELANPRANPLLMRQLAEATGGGVRLPEELPAIFLELAERPAVYENREQWSLSPWDTWPMLLMMGGFLISEWYLRKKWGLV